MCHDRAEQKDRERAAETIQLQSNLLREDDQLAVDISKDQDEQLAKHHDLFPEL